MNLLEFINSFAWVGSNILIAYIAIVVVVFVVAYYVIYDPGATTGGKFIFRFMLSLVGVIGLVFVGTFIDPAQSREWFSYPGDVASWRPLIRFAIYAYVAFTTTSLAAVLFIRRWFPHLIKKASDLTLVKPRNTSEIKTIKSVDDNESTI